MVEGTTPAPAQAAARRPSSEENTVWALVSISMLVALVGLVDGLMMAFQKKVAPCPDGHLFPPDTTDFNCYVHPHAGVGVAIAVFSVLLALAMAVSGISAAASLRVGSGAPATDAVERPSGP
jgi:hypothetical protein